jgi:hypothetical protein
MTWIPIERGTPRQRNMLIERAFAECRRNRVHDDRWPRGLAIMAWFAAALALWGAGGLLWWLL